MKLAGSVMMLVWMIAACLETASAQTLEQRRERLEQLQSSASEEATARKQRSESVLKAEGVPVNASLPVIETERELKPRTRQEVAQRAIALLIVSLKGEGLEQPIIERLVRDYQIAPHLSPDERRFLSNRTPTEHDRVQFSWRYEGAWVMLWALGYVETLDKPTTICDVPRAVTFMKDRTMAQFISDAKLRSSTEILDAADRIYRYHWAVVEARVNQQEPPAGLEPGVTMERHHALNWLIRYMDQAWDDVTTDT